MSHLFLVLILLAVGLFVRVVIAAYTQKQQQDQDDLDYQLLKRSKAEAAPSSSQAGASSKEELAHWAHAHRAEEASNLLHQAGVLADGRFDFGLDSLRHLDKWLESLRVYKGIIPEPFFQSSLYWAGAYLGETLVSPTGSGRYWRHFVTTFTSKDRRVTGRGATLLDVASTCVRRKYEDEEVVCRGARVLGDRAFDGLGSVHHVEYQHDPQLQRP